MTLSMGYESVLATDSELPFDGSSQPFEFQSENVRKTGQILDTGGMRGTRSHHVSRTRFGPSTYAGPIVINPSPLDLDIWLPRILGAAEDSDDFELAETLPEFFLLINRVAEFGDEPGFRYDNCKVNRATLRGTFQGFVELEIDIAAKGEVTNQAFPTLTLGVTDADAPYVFTDGVLTLQGESRPIRSFEVVFDNLLDVVHHNSINPTDIDPQDRIVTVRADVPWNSDNAQDLYEQALAGAAASLVLTGVSGSLETTISFAALQVPDRSPNVTGKPSIPFNLEMEARRTDDDPEVSIENVSSTP